MIQRQLLIEKQLKASSLMHFKEAFIIRYQESNKTLTQEELENILKSAPMSQYDNDESKFDNEQGELRQQCLRPHKLPYSAIGVVYVYFEKHNVKCYATAFIIEGNKGLTAAHNLIYQGQPAKTVIILMGLNGDKRQNYRPIQIIIPIQYVKSVDKQYDYGVLIFKEDEDMQKHGTIALSPQHIYQGSQIQIAGYPHDLSKIKYNQDVERYMNKVSKKFPQQKSLFFCRDCITKVKEKQLYHKVQTSKGQSGSPILRWNHIQNKTEAIGVHVSSGNKYSVGIRITKEIINQVSQCIDRKDIISMNPDIRTDFSSIIQSSVIINGLRNKAALAQNLFKALKQRGRDLSEKFKMNKLYQFPSQKQFKPNFHQYINKRPNILLIVQLKKIRTVLAAFTSIPFIKRHIPQSNQQSFIANLSKGRFYKPKNIHKTICYDQNFLLFGNSEIRIKAKSQYLYTNFGISKGFYKNGNDTVAQFLEQDIQQNFPQARQENRQDYSQQLKQNDNRLKREFCIMKYQIFELI